MLKIREQRCAIPLISKGNFIMEMQGEAQIPAPKQVVWDALNNPSVLRESIPGCEELNQEGDDSFTAKVKAKVGPVSARFSGKVHLSDIDPPNGYRIHGEGSGGAAGFAKGGATVTLEDDGAGGTVLKYSVDASVGGKLAQIGSRLIDGAARKLADEFFEKFAKLAAEQSSVPETDVDNETVIQKTSTSDRTPTTEDDVSNSSEPGKTSPEKGISLPIWLLGLAIVLGVLLYVFF